MEIPRSVVRYFLGMTMLFGARSSLQIPICLSITKNKHYIKIPEQPVLREMWILRKIQPVGDQIVSREVAHGTDCQPPEGSNYQSHRIAHGFQVYAKGQAC